MKQLIARTVRRALRPFGYTIQPLYVTTSDSIPIVYPPDFSTEDKEICNHVREFTMTSPERVAALCNAVRYLQNAKIEGAFVECGTWRGGSMMAAAQTLLNLNDQSREFYLFDTYEGMPPAGAHDVRHDGVRAEQLLAEADRAQGDSLWCVAGLDDVQRNLKSTGYDAGKLHFIRGKVEETLPDNAPAKIALLRLDTDFYESTKHELIHLFPRLAVGGVLIIDDYGFWKGARQAVDEYFAEQNINILLNRIDDTGRIAIKM